MIKTMLLTILLSFSARIFAGSAVPVDLRTVINKIHNYLGGPSENVSPEVKVYKGYARGQHPCVLQVQTDGSSYYHFRLSYKDKETDVVVKDEPQFSYSVAEDDHAQLSVIMNPRQQDDLRQSEIEISPGKNGQIEIFTYQVYPKSSWRFWDFKFCMCYDLVPQ